MATAGLAAGWVDAVVGGGGLLQLPALLLVPGISPLQALATNKMGSIFGTAVSAGTFFRHVRPDLRTALPMAMVAMAGSFAGAGLAALIPAAVFKPLIIAALIAAAVFTFVRPTLGSATRLGSAGIRHHGKAALIGASLGFYDGLLGPGTGAFLIMAMVAVLGYSFLAAGAKAKIVNLATNAGALLFFLPHGSLLWGIGLVVGLANAVGGYLGARTAVRRGSGFIRAVFLVVAAALIVKLGWDVWTEGAGA